MILKQVIIPFSICSITAQVSTAFVGKYQQRKVYSREKFGETLLKPTKFNAKYSSAIYNVPFGLDFLGLNKSEGEDKSRNSKELIAKIDSVESIDDFLKFISEDERLCIVKFRASWCKSCQKFDVHFKKLANEVADKVDPSRPDEIIERGKVKMVDVEYTANKKLCRTLGIKKLPYIHMYKGSKGRVCDFLCNSKTFNVLIDKMHENLEEDHQIVDFSFEEEDFFGALEQGSKFMNGTLEKEFNDTHVQAKQ